MTKSCYSVPQILAARDAWLVAMAALEAYRLEVNRLWLEYLELADPGRARKIRRILKHAEQGTAKTVQLPHLSDALNVQNENPIETRERMVDAVE
jgi:hypothetical protein